MSAAFPLIGHDASEARFLAARQSGRLHHGWIFQGPSGIGKSIVARRIAGLMLGADALDAAADDAVMQLILSGGHPDLKWVEHVHRDVRFSSHFDSTSYVATRMICICIPVVAGFLFLLRLLLVVTSSFFGPLPHTRPKVPRNSN